MSVYPKYNLEYTNLHYNVKSPPSGLCLLWYTDYTIEMPIFQPIIAEITDVLSHRDKITPNKRV